MYRREIRASTKFYNLDLIKYITITDGKDNKGWGEKGDRRLTLYLEGRLHKIAVPNNFTSADFSD